MADWSATALTAAQLSDGNMQFWAVDSFGQIWSTWQITTDTTYQDWRYWQMPWTPAVPAFRAAQIAVAPLPDQRLQFWTVDTEGYIWSCWKTGTAGNAPWTDFTKSWTRNPVTFTAKQVAVGPLSDHTLQCFALDTAGVIHSCWQTYQSGTLDWNDWTTNWSNTQPPQPFTWIAVAPWPDGTLQLWAVDTGGNIWSCWKSGADPSAQWTAWTQDWSAGTPPFSAKQVAAAPLYDGGLQFWAIDNNGRLWSCWQETTDPNSAWTAWTQNWLADLLSSATVCRALWPARMSDGRTALWIIDGTAEVHWTIKLTPDPSAQWQNWSLMLPMERQEHTNWCWAGCSNATSHFYEVASDWSQCKIAIKEIPSPNCCADPEPCNVYGYLNIALEIVDHFASWGENREPDSTITNEVWSGRPFGVRIAWKGDDGAHFIMVSGGGVNDMVTVKDPWFGPSYIPYDTLVSGYQHPGSSWTHSYFTE